MMYHTGASLCQVFKYASTNPARLLSLSDRGEIAKGKVADLITVDADFNINSVYLNGESYDFCIERYLTAPETDVYKAASNLKAGDVIDVEGFLYWYNGVNTHMTAVKVNGNLNAKSEGVMTFEEYDAAAIDSAVVIEAYVQATQSWWDNKITVYAQDFDGAYFIYELACSEEDAAKLVPGTNIRMRGYKAEWAGEVEIVDCTFEILKG